MKFHYKRIEKSKNLQKLEKFKTIENKLMKICQVFKKFDVELTNKLI